MYGTECPVWAIGHSYSCVFSLEKLTILMFTYLQNFCTHASQSAVKPMYFPAYKMVWLFLSRAEYNYIFSYLPIFAQGSPSMAVATVVMCDFPTKKLTILMFSYLQIFGTCLPICGQTIIFSRIQIVWLFLSRAEWYYYIHIFLLANFCTGFTVYGHRCPTVVAHHTGPVFLNTYIHRLDIRRHELTLPYPDKCRQGLYLPHAEKREGRLPLPVV